MEEKKSHLTFTSDNLAVPEIHTKETSEQEETETENKGILYDNLAMPEIHFPHPRKVDKKEDENGTV